MVLLASDSVFILSMFIITFVALDIKMMAFVFFSDFTFRMATASNIGVEPDHIIIWCDKNRAVKGSNVPERKLLENNADLNHLPMDKANADLNHLPWDEANAEINRLIVYINLDLNQTRFHRLIRSPLRMLKDENECIKCIHDSIAAGKQPFLITSGQTGAVVLPQLREESIGRLLQQLRGHTYLFCAQIELHRLWDGTL